MKTDRHSPRALAHRVKLTPPIAGRSDQSAGQVESCRAIGRLRRWARRLVLSVATAAVIVGGSSPTPFLPTSLQGQEANRPQPGASRQGNATRDTRRVVSDSPSPQPADQAVTTSDPRAVALLRQVLSTLVHGAPFHAKVRETVWTNGREVVGVGTYEQAGAGSGQFNLQVTMHDGDGKHRLQQISDGRLAWTRTEIAGNVSLRRVDVGRLDEWVGQSIPSTTIAPRLTVGAWAELLTTIERDHVLAVVGAKLENEPVWVLTGRLREERRSEVLADSGREDWPMLYPTRVHIAIRTKADPATGFGELLPVRFEFWSDPLSDESSPASSASSSAKGQEGRLITLIELYSIQPISPPPLDRFRFENRDAEVNFVNETDRYLQFFGVHLTERELRQLRR